MASSTTDRARERLAVLDQALHVLTWEEVEGGHGKPYKDRLGLASKYLNEVVQEMASDIYGEEEL